MMLQDALVSQAKRPVLPWPGVLLTDSDLSRTRPLPHRAPTPRPNSIRDPKRQLEDRDTSRRSSSRESWLSFAGDATEQSSLRLTQPDTVAATPSIYSTGQTHGRLRGSETHPQPRMSKGDWAQILPAAPAQNS